MAWWSRHTCKCRSQKKNANSWLLLYCRPNQKTLSTILTTLINWRAAKLLFKFLLCLSKENNFQDHRSHTKMIAIVVFCPVKFVEESTATRVAFVASVRVSAGERAKSDRVKIGTRVRASDGRTLARSSKKCKFLFCFRPSFCTARIGRALYSYGYNYYAGYDTRKYIRIKGNDYRLRLFWQFLVCLVNAAKW